MIVTEASSSDSEHDLSKLESKNAFLRLLAMSRLKHEVGQYFMDPLDEIDSRLLHGVYQEKVLTKKEIKQEHTFIIDKISGAKEVAKEHVKAMRRTKTLTVNNAIQDFDQIPKKPKIDSESSKSAHSVTQKFQSPMLMRTGTLNRSGSMKFKKSETEPIYLTPTKAGLGATLQRGIDEESQESEVENPVIVSSFIKKKNNNNMATTGYNMDLEPTGRQTSGFSE